MMDLGKEIKRLAGLAVLAVTACGCHIYGIDSMNSASAPNHKSPNQGGDPYTWGGIQEGTGGLVAGTKQTMETPEYSGPKFKQLAGPESFTSMSGHAVGAAKPNDVSGDWQPLPNAGHSVGDGEHGGEEEHKEEGH
jgi:hypothetical protein